MTLFSIGLDYGILETYTQGSAQRANDVINVLVPYAHRCHDIEVELFHMCYASKAWSRFCSNLRHIRTAKLNHHSAEWFQEDFEILSGDHPHLRDLEFVGMPLKWVGVQTPWTQLTRLESLFYNQHDTRMVLSQCIALEDLSIDFFEHNKGSWIRIPPSTGNTAWQRVSLPNVKRLKLKSFWRRPFHDFLPDFTFPYLQHFALTVESDEEIRNSIFIDFIERCGGDITDFTGACLLPSVTALHALKRMPRLEQLTADLACADDVFFKHLTITGDRRPLVPRLKRLCIDNFIHSGEHIRRPQGKFSDTSLYRMIESRRTLELDVDSYYDELEMVDLKLAWSLRAETLLRLGALRPSGLQIRVSIDEHVREYRSNWGYLLTLLITQTALTRKRRAKNS